MNRFMYILLLFLFYGKLSRFIYLPYRLLPHISFRRVVEIGLFSRLA